MKKQQTSSSLNFEYMKEMNFFNQKQYYRLILT